MQERCFVCDSEGRFWTEKSGRAVWRCPRCRLLWVPDGLVVGENNESIYEGDNPIFLQDGNEQYYLDATNLQSSREKLAFVAAHAAAGQSLLDVGANFG